MKKLLWYLAFTLVCAGLSIFARRFLPEHLSAAATLVPGAAMVVFGCLAFQVFAELLYERDRKNSNPVPFKPATLTPEERMRANQIAREAYERICGVPPKP